MLHNICIFRIQNTLCVCTVTSKSNSELLGIDLSSLNLHQYLFSPMLKISVLSDKKKKKKNYSFTLPQITNYKYTSCRMIIPLLPPKIQLPKWFILRLFPTESVKWNYCVLKLFAIALLFMIMPPTGDWVSFIFRVLMISFWLNFILQSCKIFLWLQH